MELERLKKEWTAPFRADVHREMWDRAAEEYAKKPLPDPEKDPFLLRMQEMGLLQPDRTILDLGCGGGGYALALSPFVKQVTGCDLSPKMTEAARRRQAEEKVSNAEFFCLDWHEGDSVPAGWERGFDTVFAHMTPAVSDYLTLDKMTRCAREACLLQKNTRRTDEFLTEVLAQIGIDEPFRDHDGVSEVLTYLWESGYEPNLTYEKTVWQARRTPEAAVGWYLDRAKLHRALTPEEEEKIRVYVQAHVQDGIVTDRTHTTIVTIDWRI